MHPVRVSVIAALIATCMISLGPAAPAPAPKIKPKLTKWIPLFEAATLQARKEKRVILAYFCSSDGDPFTKKLEKDVLNTDMFRNWAADHVILFQADFPTERKLSANTKSQNDRLKIKYGIIKVPTFILMDYSGVPFARAGWDEAKLRDSEEKEHPYSWIKYLEETIKNKPPDEPLVKQKDLTECIAYGRKHFISAVMLINQGRAERDMAAKEELTHNQQFVRFINRNVAYTEIEWPYDSDTSAEATAFRAFATAQGVEAAPLQLIVWDMQTNKVKFKLKAIDPAKADFIISLIEKQLPKIDYVGGWIEDYRQATAIAQQQKRYIFLWFESSDASEFSKKMDQEIFQTELFTKYARKHMVTVKIDFPKANNQPVPLQTQNRTLQENYNIKGYPFVIVLNPLGQKISEAKYMKGGPELFVKNLEAALKNDEDRRAFLAGEQ